MERYFLALLLLAWPTLAQQNVPAIPFTSVANYPNLPAGMNLGEVAGVAVNSKGHVFVFSRSNSATGPAFGAAAAQLFEFDENGDFVREIGKGLYAWSEAHSVRIDRNDNIWAIDKGSNMVVKFNPQGRVVWVFGRRQEAADGAGPNLWIAMMYQGGVAKFDKNADWSKSWGSKGTGPGQFNLPHSIAIDLQDNIYVGDRSNRRIQVFDTQGDFKRMFSIDVPPDPTSRAVNGTTPTGEALKRTIGAPNSMCITPGPNQVLFVGESTYPARIFKVSLEGSVLGVIGRSGRNLGQFSGAHALACPSEHEIYAAETSNWRVQKLLLH